MTERAAYSAILGFLMGGLFASSPVLAQVSANVAVTSNYVWRGLTQTDDGAALQLGIDYGHESGLYLGAWASNVEEGAEYDLYGGLAHTIGNFGYDLAYLTYNYTDDTISAESRTDIKLGMNLGSASMNYYIGDTGANADNQYTYYELGFDVALQKDVALVLRYGVLEPDVASSETTDNYRVTVRRDFGTSTLAVSYTAHEEDDDVLFVTLAREFRF